MKNEIFDIKEIMKIQGKENLNLIDLRDNKIENFNELIDIISNFPKLKKFVLKNNKPSIEEVQVIDMKKKIKEKYELEVEIII